MIHSTAEAEAPNPQPVPVQSHSIKWILELSTKFRNSFYNLQRRSLAGNHTEHAFKHGEYT